MGSPPGDRIKMRGAQEWESVKVLARLNGGGSINVCPSFATTKSCIAGITYVGCVCVCVCVCVHVSHDICSGNVM